MSDDRAAAVHEILAEELAVVTHEMIEAASREFTRISIVGSGRRAMPAEITEAQQFTAIWQAMLRVKLGAPR